MNGYLKIKTKIDNSGVDREIELLESKINDLKATLEIADENKGILSEREILEVGVEVDKLTRKLNKLKEKQINVGQDNSWDKINDKIDKASKGVSATIKKMSRWGLAIFAVESAYGFISSSMTRVKELNQDLGARIDYIRDSLAYAMMPIIEVIVNWVYKLLGLINYLTIKLFGINIFSDKMAKNFDKSNKSAKELKKTLAGFDEITKIGDNSVSGSSQSVVAKPDLNMGDATETMGNWFETTKQKWLDTIDEMKKSLENPELYSKAFGKWSTAVQGMVKLFAGLGTAFKGVGEVIKGSLHLLVGAFSGNQELISKGWEEFCNGLKSFFSGVLDFWIGLIKTKFGIIKGIVLSILGFIWDRLKDVTNKIGACFSAVGKALSSMASKVFNFFGDLFSKVGKFFYDVGYKFGSLIGNAFKTTINAILRQIEKMINTPIRGINKLIGKVNDITGSDIDKLSTISFPRLASGGIVNKPGSGVLMGNYIAGESGREGVLPLSDPDTMRMLGEEIGKWINSNNNTYVYLDGKLIQREINSANNQLLFETNGRG